MRSLRLKVQDRPVELLFGDHEEQCRIVGDKNRLMQVITNFINNAVKFTEQGSITLGYRREAGDLLFYVEDTGKGISEEHLRTVFDRFVKLNSFAQGTGLGLSISKSIVEQMGGHIGVESEEGRGSRFWFTIPAVACNAGPDDEPSVVAEAPHPVSRQDGKLPLLLVAEDTDSNFLLVSLMFRKEFDIVRAVNGEEAVRICREMNPAAILMDIKMPVMDGFEATRQIRRFDPAVPIVAVTAFAYDRARQKALAAERGAYSPRIGDIAGGGITAPRVTGFAGREVSAVFGEFARRETMARHSPPRRETSAGGIAQCLSRSRLPMGRASLPHPFRETSR